LWVQREAGAGSLRDEARGRKVEERSAELPYTAGYSTPGNSGSLCSPLLAIAAAILNPSHLQRNPPGNPSIPCHAIASRSRRRHIFNEMHPFGRPLPRVCGGLRLECIGVAVFCVEATFVSSPFAFFSGDRSWVGVGCVGGVGSFLGFGHHAGVGEVGEEVEPAAGAAELPTRLSHASGGGAE
jgi:hypothetical protein